MKVIPKSDTVIALGAELPKPVLQVIDDAGEVWDLDTQVSDSHLELIPVSYAGDITNLADGVVEPTEDIITFTWGTETATEGSVRSVLHLDLTGGGGLSLFAPTYIVYDPASLWVNPAELEAMVGTDFTDTELIRAILLAQSLVGAWVSYPVQSPVPGPIRQATLIVAARALTSQGSVGGGSGTVSGAIVSESIADYTVRYATPDSGDWPSQLFGADVMALLDPYHSRIKSMQIGPANPVNPLPVYDIGWWWDYWEGAIDPYRDLMESQP